MASQMRGWAESSLGISNPSSVETIGLYTDSNTGEIIQFPGGSNDIPQAVDMSSAFGGYFEDFGAGRSSYDPASFLPFAQGSYTYTSLPHGASTENFTNTFAILDLPVLNPTSNRVYYFGYGVLVHTYNVGGTIYKNYYLRPFLVEFDLTARTVNTYTALGLGQQDWDEFNGDTAWSDSYGYFPFIPTFAGVAAGNLYVGKIRRNGTIYMTKIVLSTQTASWIDITSSGFSTAGATQLNERTLEGVSVGSNTYCVPANWNTSLVQNFVKINGTTDAITTGLFGLSNTYSNEDRVYDSTSGLIICAPGNNSSLPPGVLFIDTSTDTAFYSTLGGIHGGGRGIAIAKSPVDGFVYLFSRAAAENGNIFRIDPANYSTNSEIVFENFGTNPLQFYSNRKFAKISSDNNFFLAPNTGNGGHWVIGGFAEIGDRQAATINPNKAGNTAYQSKHNGLDDPFILWDFRNLTDDFIIPNEGTAGDIWDLLHTSNSDSNAVDMGFEIQAREELLQNEHMGGENTSKAFTMLIAHGDFTGYSVGARSNQEAFIEMNAIQTGTAIGTYLRAYVDCELIQGAIRAAFSSHDLAPDYYFHGYIGAVSDNYNEFETATVFHPEVPSKPWMLVFDSIKGGGSFIIDKVKKPPVTAITNPATSNNLWETYYLKDLDIADQYGIYDNVLARLTIFRSSYHVHDYINLGDLNTKIYPYITNPTGFRGFALFRGTPTESQIDYWSDYFYV